MEKRELFVVTVLGYWGKGNLLCEAAANCLDAGARKTDDAVGYVYHGPKEKLSEITVGDFGISYPADSVTSIRLFGPKDSKIKLGNLLRR